MCVRTRGLNLLVLSILSWWLVLHPIANMPCWLPANLQLSPVLTKCASSTYRSGQAILDSILLQLTAGSMQAGRSFICVVVGFSEPRSSRLCAFRGIGEVVQCHEQLGQQQRTCILRCSMKHSAWRVGWTSANRGSSHRLATGPTHKWDLYELAR